MIYTHGELNDPRWKQNTEGSTKEVSYVQTHFLI